ncbi:MAG: hypothetical protein ACK5KL_14650 [Dysgonomonas sp.]
MRKIYLAIFLALLFYNCGGPKNFTYRYEDKNTGLDKLIDINGYYVSQHRCDSTFYSMYMFYTNGLFTIATTSEILPELIDCFENGGQSDICKYPLWGTYKVEGDLIKTQVIREEGNKCVIFRDYKILPDGNIVNISDYVQPEYTNLGYMENYPSFKENPCSKKADFYPLKFKRDSTACPFLKKKWFRDK